MKWANLVANLKKSCSKKSQNRDFSPTAQNDNFGAQDSAPMDDIFGANQNDNFSANQNDNFGVRDSAIYKKSQLDSALYKKSQKINPKDYAFLAFAFALCAGICAFSFWLGFPGFHIIGDTYNSIALAKNNWHPVFIAYILQGLYIIFGKNLYYLFLFNLVPFYLGIWFLIAGFYLRFKNPFALLLIFPTFIGNIYFQNFIQYHSFALPMMVFCIYALLLFLIFAESKCHKIIKKSLWILLFTLMFFAILWRHNAIFSVYPAFFIIIYLFLQNRGLDSAIFCKVGAKLIILSAILCLAVVIFIPKVLQTSKSHAANHPFLHQIAGACVPANDATCFKKEWYYPHKNFSDVVALYEKYPLNADPMNVTWAYDDERPFLPQELKGLKMQWIRAIAKYPLNFLRHEGRFFKAMWWQNPSWIFDAKKIQEKATHEWHISVVGGFKEAQRSVNFTPLREKIYTFLFNHKILLNHAWGVGVGFVILMLSSALLWRWRKDIFADSAKLINSYKFAESKLNSTHPLTPSAMEGESLENFSAMEGKEIAESASFVILSEAKNLKNRDSSIALQSQNDNIIAESPQNHTKIAESTLDSAIFTNNALLIFCFAVSFATFWSAFFIAAFSPVPETRYMSPILPMAIVALVGFVGFIADSAKCKNRVNVI
ncbi:hypothetical protein ACWIUD_09340 [Helicobacter sp. 23-1044]